MNSTTSGRDDPPGIPARRAAMRLLDAVLRQGVPLEAAFGAATAGIDRADDRGLAHAIAAAVLRHLVDLDALIDSATAKPLPHDAKARFALRIALAQRLALATPAHAAIATVLPLLDGGPKRLVHGVFGTLMRQGIVLPEPPALLPSVAKRWRKAWGQEMIEAARVASAVQPPLDLALRDPAATAAWTERLAGTSLATGHVRIDSHADLTALPGFAEGDWWVQDLAASLPARMLGAGEGRRVLDLCAAPGGKTMQLAAAGWRVTALDAAETRLARLSENLGRTGLNAEVVCADALAWTPQAPFDAVLLDAPCSATGIFRRHPDVLHRVGDRAIGELAETQAKLLARAADWVAPGGRLVYAVCSLEPAEGEGIADSFARDRRFARDPVAAEELPQGIEPGAAGRVRVLPGMLAEAGGIDGFFVARFARTG